MANTEKQHGGYMATYSEDLSSQIHGIKLSLATIFGLIKGKKYCYGERHENELRALHDAFKSLVKLYKEKKMSLLSFECSH